MFKRIFMYFTPISIHKPLLIPLFKLIFPFKSLWCRQAVWYSPDLFSLSQTICPVSCLAPLPSSKTDVDNFVRRIISSIEHISPKENDYRHLLQFRDFGLNNAKKCVEQLLWVNISDAEEIIHAGVLITRIKAFIQHGSQMNAGEECCCFFS